MSFPEYLKVGQKVVFEISGDKAYKYTVQVNNISDTVIDVKLSDNTLNPEKILSGTKGALVGKTDDLQFSFDVVTYSVEDSSHILLKRIHSRSLLRVDAFIALEYKKISDEDYFKKRGKYIHGISHADDEYFLSPGSQTGELLEQQPAIPPEFMSEIRSIHRKLDFIIKLLEKSDTENIFSREPENINISGSGLKFHTCNKFKVGDYLEIKLVLPMFSNIIIEVIGRVVRVVEQTGTCDSKTETAAKFVAINEDDRELVIRYIFKRQRELLRADDMNLN